MAHSIPARLTPAEGRKFGLTLGGAFLVISAIMWYRGHHTPAPYAATLGGALIVAGLLVPTALSPVNKAWMGLAQLLSKVTTPVFMSVVYFVVLTPVGVLRRAFGKNAMVAPTAANGGHWVTKNPRAATSMQRQF